MILVTFITNFVPALRKINYKQNGVCGAFENGSNCTHSCDMEHFEGVTSYHLIIIDVQCLYFSAPLNLSHLSHIAFTLRRIIGH